MSTWIVRYEDGALRTVTQDEAREVMRDLFNCEDDDCEPRAMTDNEIRPKGEA